MSAGLPAMAAEEADVAKMLAASTHLGTNNNNYQMEQYVWKRRTDGVHIINLKRTYEKLLLAARAIAAIESPTDVYVISSRPMGQRAVLKYARYTGATAIAGRFTPGAFTNQIQAAFREPRLLVVTDPLSDHQSITEASYVNIPVIAFANTDSPLRFVDITIPCNNKGTTSVGLMWWMLAREVLRLRGSISRAIPWEHEVMPDLFFYRDPEEQEKEEVQKAEAEAAAAAAVVAAVKQEAPVMADNNWGEGAPEISGGAIIPQEEWVAAPSVTSAPAVPVAAAGVSPVAPIPGQVQDDWSQPTDDWASGGATTTATTATAAAAVATPAATTAAAADDWSGAAAGDQW